MELIVEEMCNNWLNDKKNNLKYTSYFKYEAILNNYLRKFITQYSLESINAEIINQYFQYLIEEKHSSIQLVNTIKTVLKSLYRYGEKNYNLKHIDFNLIEIHKPKHSKQQVLTPKHQIILYNYCINDINPINLAILMALYTGLRLGEICALKYSDFNMNDYSINIQRNVQITNDNNKKTEKEIEITNWASKRIVFLPCFLYRYINEYFKIYKTDTNYHLISNDNNFYKPRTLQTKMQEIAAKLNIQCTFNILRNTFQNNCIASGMNIYSILSMMGIANMTFELKENMRIDLKINQSEIQKLKIYES